MDLKKARKFLDNYKTPNFQLIISEEKMNNIAELMQAYADEQLLIHSVVGRSEQLKPEQQICYKSNEPCKYDCSGLCRESC